jgi:hypothetical protein
MMMTTMIATCMAEQTILRDERKIEVNITLIGM